MRRKEGGEGKSEEGGGVGGTGKADDLSRI